MSFIDLIFFFSRAGEKPVQSVVKDISKFLSHSLLCFVFINIDESDTEQVDSIF